MEWIPGPWLFHRPAKKAGLGTRLALSQLGKPDLKLKDKQQQAIAAIYSGQDVFVFLPTGVSAFRSSLFSLTTS